jgi:flagellar biosynthesis chaperone FliJ
MTQEEFRLKQDLLTTRDPDELCRALLMALARETEIWRDLRAIIVSERETIKRPSSLDALRDLNAKKETVIWKLKMLEEVRAGYIRKIGRAMGIPENEVNMTSLSGFLEGEVREDFQSCRRNLKSLLRDIHELNRGNQNLLDVSVALLRNAINFIQELATGNPVYQNSGRLTRSRCNGRIVQTKG